MSRSRTDRPSPAAAQPGERGFTLLEAIVAIALVGIAILVSAAFLNALIVSADQLRIQTGLLHEVESAVEMMRADLIPLESGVLETSGLSAPEGLTVTAIVEPQSIPGLYAVTVRAECLLRGRRVSRMLQTAIWRP